MKKKIILFISHSVFLIFGVGLGIYLLPILTAPKSIEITTINELEKNSLYTTEFVRELRGSDLFHWGEAKVTISNKKIIVNGSIAPGPDYKLYLTNTFVENEKEFLKIKNRSKYVSDVKTFKNFVVDISDEIDIKNYNSIIIWCEAFNEFITSAKYK